MIATLGNYQIIREIGRGGMGVVYEGLDTRLDRRVAIKTIDLPTDASVSPEAYQELVARFQTEAKAIAKLSHPNIVTIYDFGQEDGRQYMVQELLQGRSLAQMLQTYAPLPVDTVIRASAQACAALDFAHDQGIIHRDVKPGNMILLDNGTLKLMDFGIARLETGSAGMTKAGNILGSLLYISPEQLVNAAKIDRRADIYSLGVSMYEMLTGRLPYNGDNIGELVMAIMQSLPQRPSQVNPQVPEALEAIILRAMAKEADKRFGRASEMGQALSALAGGGGSPAVTGPLGLGSVTQAGAQPAITISPTMPGDQAAPPSIALGLNEYALVEGVDALTPFTLVHRVITNWETKDLGNKGVGDLLLMGLNEGQTCAFIINQRLILLMYKGLLLDGITMDEDLTGQSAFETLGAAAQFQVVKCQPSEPKEPWIVILSAMLGSAKLTNQHVIRSSSQAADLWDALRKEKITGFVRQADGNQLRYQGMVAGDKAFAVIMPDNFTAAERNHATEVDVYSPRPQLIGPSLRKGYNETVLEVVSKSINRPSLKQLATQKDAKVTPEMMEEAIRNTELTLVGAPDKAVPCGSIAFKYADLLKDLPPCRVMTWLFEGYLFQASRSPKFAPARGSISWLWHLKSVRLAQTLRTGEGNVTFDIVAYDAMEKLCFVMRMGPSGSKADVEKFVADVTAIKRLMPDKEAIKAALYVAPADFADDVAGYYDKATAKPFGLSLLTGGPPKGFVTTKQGGGFILNLATDGEHGLEMLAPNVL
jgi:hypothetical protein